MELWLIFNIISICVFCIGLGIDTYNNIMIKKNSKYIIPKNIDNIIYILLMIIGWGFLITSWIIR